MFLSRIGEIIMDLSFSVANLTKIIPSKHELIERHLDDKSLGDLSSPIGMNIVINETPTNFHIGWLKNEGQEITGVFFRFVTTDMVVIQKVYDKLKHHQAHELTITRNYTGTSDRMLHWGFYRSLFSVHRLDKADEVTLELVGDQLQNPEVIQAFCAGQREMLPQAFRDALIPPRKVPEKKSKDPQKKDNPDINPRNVALVNRALVLGTLLFTVIYFAKPIRDTLFPKAPPVKPEGPLPVKALA